MKITSAKGKKEPRQLIVMLLLDITFVFICINNQVKCVISITNIKT